MKTHEEQALAEVKKEREQRDRLLEQIQGLMTKATNQKVKIQALVNAKTEAAQEYENLQNLNSELESKVSQLSEKI